MVIRIIFFLTLFFFLSCIPTERLAGGNKVPKKGYVFKNTNKINNLVYQAIDSQYFYKLKGIFFSDKNFNKTRNYEFSGWVTTIQFYQNGRLRLFADEFRNPNSKIDGRRGIIYIKNNIIKVDITESDQDGSMYIVTYTAKVQENKIFLLENNAFFLNNNETMCFVYEKSEKIPEDWKQYKADW